MLLLVIYALGGNRNPFFQILEFKLLDVRFHMRGARIPSEHVVIVAVDDASIDYFGAWPWPRSIHADLLEILQADGARVIGFDILFSNDQESVERSLLRQLRQHYLSSPLAQHEPHGKQFGRLLTKALQQSDDDRILVEAIRKCGNVVLPFIVENTRCHEGADSPAMDISTDGELTPEFMEHLLASPSAEEELLPPELDTARFKHVSCSSHPGVTNRFTDMNLQLPLPQHLAASRYVGATNCRLDADGSLRRNAMAVSYGKYWYQSFALQVLKLWYEWDEKAVRLNAASHLQIDDLRIPLDAGNCFLIDYVGPAYTIPYYSYAEVMEHQMPPDTFRDKIVLVGYAATGMGDVWTTPFSPTMPGVESHANVISNILQHRFLTKDRWSWFLALGCIFCIGLAAGTILSRLSALKGVGAALLIMLVIFFLNYALFAVFNVWVDLAWPLLTHIVLTVGVIAFKFFDEETNRKFLKATFESYLSPALINEMYQRKIKPSLGGEARPMTPFFTDIEGFSSFSEILTPEQLVELLNEYLSAMTHILLDEKGTLDKYEGDAIVAFFGAPLALPDHALRACRAGLRMQQELERLRKKWRQEKQAPDEPERNMLNLPADVWQPGDKWPRQVHHMKMRIGIHSGIAVVGNMGSPLRMNYTMMGDAVNLAARLESAGKQFGLYTTVSEETLNQSVPYDRQTDGKVHDHFEIRYIGAITVVGKSRPVRIYELCALKGQADGLQQQLCQYFAQGVNHYYQRDWEQALNRFKRSLMLEPHAENHVTPSAFYLERCQYYQRHPWEADEKNWDGIFHLNSK
jgi:adenylate cyclase